MKNPEEEWRQLTALYAEMGETELFDLKASFDDLTEVAQGALRDEMKRRALWDLPLPKDDPKGHRPERAETADDAYGDLRLEGVTVGEYDSVNEANLASYVLELAGMRSVVADSDGKFDVRLPFVRVAPEDAEKASELLAQPIPAGVRADHEATRSLPEFEVPVCPHCACDEVLLEEIEPTNHWLCGECDHRWADPMPANES